MPHLSARECLAFPIVMEVGSWKPQQSLTFGVLLDRLNILPDEIDHGGWTPETHALGGQTADHSDLLFELGKTTGIKCIMPRIVRAWSHLVDQDHGVRQQKQFEAEQSDAIHAFDHAAGKRLGPFGDAGSYQCRDER